jgi:hypothetical protein
MSHPAEGLLPVPPKLRRQAAERIDLGQIRSIAVDIAFQPGRQTSKG